MYSFMSSLMHSPKVCAVKFRASATSVDSGTSACSATMASKLVHGMLSSDLWATAEHLDETMVTACRHALRLSQLSVNVPGRLLTLLIQRF